MYVFVWVCAHACGLTIKRFYGQKEGRVYETALDSKIIHLLKGRKRRKRKDLTNIDLLSF